MADFKTVHHRELVDAAHHMRTSTRDHWNILLREPIRPTEALRTDPDAAP